MSEQLELFEPGAHLDWREGHYQPESVSRHRFCLRCRYFHGWALQQGCGECELKRRRIPEYPRVRAYGICDYFEAP